MVYPIIYRVSTIQWCRISQPSTVSPSMSNSSMFWTCCMFFSVRKHCCTGDKRSFRGSWMSIPVSNWLVSGSVTQLYLYIYIHIYTYIHIYIYTHIHVHIYTYTHIHIYTYTHLHIYTFTHIHIYTYTAYTYIYTYIYIYIYIYTYIYIYIYIYVDAPSRELVKLVDYIRLLVKSVNLSRNLDHHWPPPNWNWINSFTHDPYRQGPGRCPVSHRGWWLAWPFISYTSRCLALLYCLTSKNSPQKIWLFHWNLQLGRRFPSRPCLMTQ